MSHDPYDPTMQTKWGRVTSQEWFRLRFEEQLDKWLGPLEMHYILTRTPYHDAKGQQIHDHAFIALLQSDPEAAHRQLLQEEIAFDNDLAVRCAARARESKQQPPARRRRRMAAVNATHQQTTLI